MKWKGPDELKPFLVPIDELHGFPGNPDRNEADVYFIARSLIDFGQTRPVLTWGNAEEHGCKANTIVGGHHVVRAAKTICEWTHVAVMPAQFANVSAARNYLVVDNVASHRDAQQIAEQKTIFDDDEASPELAAAMNEAARATGELVLIDEVQKHERSYKQHPEEQLNYLKMSLERYGFYKPIVIAEDGTILTGHGVYEAAKSLGFAEIPVTRMPFASDDPRALELMASDNEIQSRADIDDRELAEILKYVQEEVGDLRATGFDGDALAAYLLMTRPSAEIKDANQAHEWIGLPEYEAAELPQKVVVSFDSVELRDRFLDGHWSPSASETTVPIAPPPRKVNMGTTSIWFPSRGQDDVASLRFVGTRPSDLDLTPDDVAPQLTL